MKLKGHNILAIVMEFQNQSTTKATAITANSQGFANHAASLLQAAELKAGIRSAGGCAYDCTGAYRKRSVDIWKRKSRVI